MGDDLRTRIASAREAAVEKLAQGGAGSIESETDYALGWVDDEKVSRWVDDK